MGQRHYSKAGTMQLMAGEGELVLENSPERQNVDLADIEAVHLVKRGPLVHPCEPAMKSCHRGMVLENVQEAMKRCWRGMEGVPDRLKRASEVLIQEIEVHLERREGLEERNLNTESVTREMGLSGEMSEIGGMEAEVGGSGAEVVTRGWVRGIFRTASELEGEVIGDVRRGGLYYNSIYGASGLHEASGVLPRRRSQSVGGWIEQVIGLARA